MSDNKQNVGAQDRARVAGEEDYEVRHFADKHGLSMDAVRELIARHGNDRDALEAAVRNRNAH
jgi:hypothetical protein